MSQAKALEPVCSRSGTDLITRPPVLSSHHTVMTVRCRAVTDDQTVVPPVQG